MSWEKAAYIPAWDTWRWGLLLGAQDVHVSHTALLSSYLVAIFFNNFLPSNIGGDVVRIRDTARPARSKTLATTVILIDRVLGMLGLVLVAAIGATVAGRVAGSQLRAIGLPELVVRDLGEYEALALSLAQEPLRLADCRRRLAINRATHPLFDMARFVADLEARLLEACPS